MGRSRPPLWAMAIPLPSLQHSLFELGSPVCRTQFVLGSLSGIWVPIGFARKWFTPKWFASNWSHRTTDRSRRSHAWSSSDLLRSAESLSCGWQQSVSRGALLRRIPSRLSRVRHRGRLRTKCLRHLTHGWVNVVKEFQVARAQVVQIRIALVGL